MSEATDPVIADEPVAKKQKLSTLKYKIQPELPYFPGDRAQAESLKKQFENFDFTKHEISDEKLKLRAEYWEVKAHFTMGDYKVGLEMAD